MYTICHADDRTVVYQRVETLPVALVMMNLMWHLPGRRVMLLDGNGHRVSYAVLVVNGKELIVDYEDMRTVREGRYG